MNTKNHKFEKNIKLAYNKFQEIKYLEYLEIVFGSQAIYNAKLIPVLNGINSAKIRLYKHLKLNLASLKLKQFVAKKQKQRFRRTCKKAFLIVCGVAAFHFPALKAVHAVEVIKQVKHTTPTFVEKAKNFIYYEDINGKKKFNKKNLLLAGLTLTAFTSLVLFILTDEDYSTCKRLLFRAPMVIPPAEIPALTMEEKEYIKIITNKIKEHTISNKRENEISLLSTFLLENATQLMLRPAQPF